MTEIVELPLAGIRILELADGPAEYTGRYLADLGAEVVKVEPPRGARSRAQEPVAAGVSIPFALRNANKTIFTLDLAAAPGRDRFGELAAEVDIVLESSRPGELAAVGLSPRELLECHPTLVVTSVTDFGQTGPYRDWAATELVLAALGGVLSRSGLPGAEPLLPPAGLVAQTVAVHAAWATLVAYTKRLRTGLGEYVDVSAFEAVVHGFDPGFGTQGSAAAGRAEDFPRGRPDARQFYPVFPCRDGHVRICLLAKRQWRAMFTWLGEPAEFADRRYDTIAARFRAAGKLHPLIGRLFRDRGRDELVAEAAARGVPLAAVLTPADVLRARHFDVTGAFVTAEIAPGVRVRVPSGYVTIDGRRAGYRTPAPEQADSPPSDPARSSPAPSSPVRSSPVRSDPARSDPARPGDACGHDGGFRPGAFGAAGYRDGGRPLDGVRVLDLGVIVFGAELGRLLADQGADVIKIENAAFPDGLRQSRRGEGMSASFAWGQRNKRGLGLDLRHPKGAEVFRALVARSDVVLANFKPGTLESLGFSYADLAAINPRIIVSDSSAFGAAGPWSARMGYGPLVRATCGVSELWRYPGSADAFCDGSTVYPDHVAAHVAAVAVLAGLISRDRGRGGRGMSIAIAQADVAVVALGEVFAAASLPSGEAGRGAAGSDEFGSGVFACAGDDEWCVVSVRDDEDWARLCGVLGRPDLAHDPTMVTAMTTAADPAAWAVRRESMRQEVAAWAGRRSPREVMEVLQGAGVPAGAMMRLPDELVDPQLVARETFVPLKHDRLAGPIPASARAARFSTIPDPALGPAPVAGEHTREICSTVLGLAPGEIDELIQSGVIDAARDFPVI